MKKDLLLRIFSKIPPISTERLRLRQMRVDDYIDMYDYARRPDVTEYLTWHAHESSDYTRHYLEYVQTQYKSGEFYDWAVVLEKTGKMIGTCGFTRLDTKNNCGEVGYVINPDHQNNGYASEALLAVMRFGFLELNLHRIEAKHIEGNDASRRVMQKCGMQYEGAARSSMFIKGAYRTVCTCAILSDEFIKRFL